MTETIPPPWAKPLTRLEPEMWFAPSVGAAVVRALRQEDLRQWFGRLLADSGFSEYEEDLAKLEPLALPPPPPP
jgi:hypothetical protein